MLDNPAPATLATLVPLDRRRWVLRHAINPALAELRPLPAPYRACHIMLAIAGMESRCLHRRQIPIPHAMGLWQFERGGGVAGVLQHRVTRPLVIGALERRGLPAPDKPGAAEATWRALETDDTLAAILARLLLLSDPAPLPDDPNAALGVYLRTWRPGKPQSATQWLNEWRVSAGALAQP